MGSPFKMNPKSPLMKALVGKQGNLPQHLQDAIKAAPESPAKSYGKSPMKKDPSVTDDVVISSKQKEVKRKKGGGTNIVTTEVSERGGKGLGTTAGDRRGVGRIQEKKYVKMKGTGKKGSKGSTVSTKISGAAGTRKDGSGILIEKTVSAITPKKAAGAKITASRLEKNKGKSPAKMKGVAGLKKKSKAPKTTASKGMPKAPNAKMEARVKRVGKQGSPVKSTDGKRKLGTEGMSYKEKMAYYEKQKKAKAAKNPKVRMGMGTSYTTIKK